jgi:hypothetical protein
MVDGVHWDYERDISSMKFAGPLAHGLWDHPSPVSSLCLFISLLGDPGTVNDTLATFRIES